ncbi:MAG: YbbR-like domain-containing protein [Bacillales bacterium]
MGKLDKLFDNPWFIRIMALILALLLFENVIDQKMPEEENVPPGQETEVIEEVPVKVYYDTENLVVSGVPKTVTLELTGPRNIVQQAITQQKYEVYVDLSDVELGTQKVPIQIRNISDKIDVNIDPPTAIVTVQEKITAGFSVEAEFNSGLLPKGYTIKQKLVEPKRVKITGAKDVVESIAYVKATLDLKDEIKETLTEQAEVQAFDKNLNKLDVAVEPEKVKVTLVVEANTKQVPVRVIERNSLPDGVTLESLSLNVEEVTIIGPDEALDRTEFVNVELDLSEINKDMVLTLPVVLPEGVVESSPDKVEVTIKVRRTESRTLKNLPIQVEGLSDEYMVSFLDDSEVDLVVYGNSERVKSLKASDFKVYIDVAGLHEGDHSVPIKVRGPEQIEWKLEKSSVKIQLTKEEA